MGQAASTVRGRNNAERIKLIFLSRKQILGSATSLDTVPTNILLDAKLWQEFAGFLVDGYMTQKDEHAALGTCKQLFSGAFNLAKQRCGSIDNIFSIPGGALASKLHHDVNAGMERRIGIRAIENGEKTVIVVRRLLK